MDQSTQPRDAAPSSGTVGSLPRVVPAPPGKPTRPEARENQRLAAALARTPQMWDAGHAAAMASRFDELAPTWESERGGYRLAPLLDALDRGGPFPAGLCLEIGAGTGILTRELVRRWPQLVAVDLSHQMLVRSPHPWRVRADAARLPLRTGAAAVVVIGDAPLFAAEVCRVLAPHGVLIWVNALGAGAPFHLPTRDLVAALAAASSGELRSTWAAVESDAGWGSWVALRRTPGVSGSR